MYTIVLIGLLFGGKAQLPDLPVFITQEACQNVVSRITTTVGKPVCEAIK